jgi:hypothetical protein
MRFKNKKQEDNFLLYIPNKKHTTFEEKKGKVKLIFYHDKAIEKFSRWLVKKPRVSDVELDEIGSTTWNLIDGKKSVYDISLKLYEKYGERCNPNNNSLVMYLRYMNRKGWISFEKGEQQ